MKPTGYSNAKALPFVVSHGEFIHNMFKSSRIYYFIMTSTWVQNTKANNDLVPFFLHRDISAFLANFLMPGK